MPHAESRRFLHVANGHSTTRLISRAGIPGTLSVWADPLHEGPVPNHLADPDLLAVRARHLATDDHPREKVAAELRCWREAVDGFAAYEEVVLWYEHDLFDQLNLIQVFDRLASLPRGISRFSLIERRLIPGRPSFKGIGELTPDELGALFETRQGIHDRQFAVAQAGWHALRSPDPRALEALLSTDLSALPFLAAALRRHLDEFPSSRNGLSRSEQHLLEIVAAGRSEIWDVCAAMHDGETCFYIADLSFWRVVTGLSHASPPLLTVLIESRASGQLPRGTVALTPAGRDVLAGRAERVGWCGIDRWLGGVYLTTDSRWRRDPANAVITLG